MVGRRRIALVFGLLALASAAVGSVSIRKPTAVVIRGHGVPSDQPDAPAQPAGLTADLAGVDIVLDWSDVAGATEYRVYRGFGGGSQVVEVVSASTWTDTTTVSGAPHYYRVAAVNATGQVSTLSAEASAWPVSVKAYRTPFYYLDQWGDYQDVAMPQARVDSLAHFDAIGFMPHFYEGAHEAGYDAIINRVREAAATLDGHEVVGLTYFFGNALRFNWAPGPVGLTHPTLGYQSPYPAQYDRSVNPYTRMWDWCVANDAFLHDINGQPMVNLQYPVYNFDYGNLALADTLAAYTVEAYANGPTDGEYCGFLYDFINTDVQDWTADLNSADIDRDGLAYNSSTQERDQEIALYRAWHLHCIKAIRREFGERGMHNRLIVVNGNGVQSSAINQSVYGELSNWVDGFMQERWNDGTSGYPGWSSARFTTEQLQYDAWTGVLTTYVNPERYPHSQVRPYPFMFHMYVNNDASGAQWNSLLPALATNGWAHGNNPTYLPRCGTADLCYGSGSNGTYDMSLPPTRLDPGAAGTFSILRSTNWPTQVDTLRVPTTNYTARMVLRPNGPSQKNPWPFIIIAANHDTLARGGGWPRQEYVPPPIAAPNLASAAGGAGGVNLSWGVVSGATKYRVFRNTSAGATVPIDSTTTATTYFDGSGAEGVTYYYRIKAVDGSGVASAYSNELSASWAPSASPAVSGVTGTVSQGQSITITGTNFGSKSAAPPFKFDDFQSGTEGSKISTTGTHPWSLYAADAGVAELPNCQARLSRAQQRFAGDQTAWQEFGKNNSCNGTLFTDNNTISLSNIGRTVYISGWAWNNRSADGLATGSRNAKIFQHTDYPYQVGPQTRWDVYPTNGSSHVTSQCDDNGGPLAGGYDINDWGGVPLPSTQSWHRIEIFHDYGQESAGTETYQIWIDHALVKNISVPHRAAACDNMSDVYLMWYFDDVETGGTWGAPWMDWYWSELYLDTTRARVEIGNASTYAACTHREIQIPNAWSDSSITTTVNTGSLADGPAWIFVVDAAGAVSDGYEIAVSNSPAQYAAIISATINMAAGKIAVKNMQLPEGCLGTVTVRFMDVVAGTQIGVTRTAGPGNLLTVAGVNCADGIEVRAEYTMTTATPGFQDVAAWTTIAIVEMDTSVGDVAVTPDTPLP